MGLTLAQKILDNHIVEGDLITGSEIGIRIDQTLTQDATGTMAYLQFEALGIPRVKTQLSVSYVDHNTLQSSFENADDHIYLQSVAKKYGIFFSKPGNGICHQVHLERFGIPGKTLLGSDSHTPTGGGLGMIAIGAGGLDVAVAMAGAPFYLTVPKIVGIHLKGSLSPFVSAKDIILHLLGLLSVKGGVGRIIEYFGEGVQSLSVPERSTITNMGAELGATTSIFPSDEQTLKFLKMQQRENAYKPIEKDEDAEYDEVYEVDLSALEPLAACPHSPDNIKAVKELKHIRVDQVIIGSCTNSSLKDLKMVSELLKGKTVHPEVSFVVAPGSKQVLEELSRSGALSPIIQSGARIIESACGPCIGMGQAPKTGGVSLRTFNRNFMGRSGTVSGNVYIVSPETAVASALSGIITNPMLLGSPPKIAMPDKIIINDNLIIPPGEKSEGEIIRGPNIKPLPQKDKMPADLNGEVLLKVEDNITTDHIMPAGAKILPLRSNIPAISEYVFSIIDEDFPKRARERNGGFIVGGENYGQGSSREHAALAPMYLGVKAVIVKSFARIHRDNLINFGILPLVFKDPVDYERIQQGDILSIPNVKEFLSHYENEITIKVKSSGADITVLSNLSKRQSDILLAGGKLNWTKQQIGSSS